MGTALFGIDQETFDYLFPITRRHQRLATGACGTVAPFLYLLTGFQSIGINKDWLLGKLFALSQVPVPGRFQSKASPKIGDCSIAVKSSPSPSGISNQKASPRIGDFLLEVLCGYQETQFPINRHYQRLATLYSWNNVVFMVRQFSINKRNQGLATARCWSSASVILFKVSNQLASPRIGDLRTDTPSGFYRVCVSNQ